jgi:ammonia channel protein AmtB
MFRRFARDVIWLDDALGVISIFGVPGALGVLLTAFVADKDHYGSPLNGLFRDLNDGALLFKSQVRAWCV